MSENHCQKIIKHNNFLRKIFKEKLLCLIIIFVSYVYNSTPIEILFEKPKCRI